MLRCILLLAAVILSLISAVAQEKTPRAVKFLELESGQTFDEEKARLLVTALKENPNDTFYAVASEIPGYDTGWLYRQNHGVRMALLRSEIPRTRIVLKSVSWKAERLQFWRVPEGADPPVCLECDEWLRFIKDCPTITITGPAGVAMPGDPMSFQVTLTGNVPKNIGYRWSVVGGAIMSGPERSVLLARYISVSEFRAIVTVAGLPEACPAQASEGLWMTGPEPYAIQLGEINNPTYTIPKNLLKSIGRQMKDEASSQLYVWIYVGSMTQLRSQQVRSRLLRQLSTTGIDSSRFTIQISSDKSRGAIFWRIPPRADNPAP